MTATTPTPEPVTELPPATAALHRAMPFTRLVDCGMDHADARHLLAATAAGADWEATATELGKAQHTRSLDAAAAGHQATAVQACRFAIAAFLFAQMARNTDDDMKRTRYRRYVAQLEHLTQLSGPSFQRWELPYRSGTLTGWLCLPPAGTAQATVVIWGGLSGWGAAYLPIADALTQRGLACVLAEGPGQGESRLEHALYVDEDIADGFGQFLDAVHADPRLGDRVGIQGNSFGGLFAALLAAGDPRVGACVINGAPSAPQVPEFRGAREQIFAALGTEDLHRAQTVLTALAFDGQQRRIPCPLFVLHGAQDRLVTDAEQRRFLLGADPTTSQLRSWPEGEHTLYNHAAERNALTADWFGDQLLRT